MSNEQEHVTLLPIYDVEPDRNQPRKNFDKETIRELADSIAEYGILEPILVTRKDSYYKIVAGERRWRAARQAGLKKIPVIIKELDDRQADEIALLENIQREDLNPIETANAYLNLMNRYEYSADEIASKLHKSRSSVANSLRLLKLSKDVQEMIIAGQLSEGHAKVIAGIDSKVYQTRIAEAVCKNGLSVRDTEKLIKSTVKKKPRKRIINDAERDDMYKWISEELQKSIGTKVNVKKQAKNIGVIEIEFYSDDDLDRLYTLLKNM